MLNCFQAACLAYLLSLISSALAQGQEGRFVDLRPIPGLPATLTSADTGPSVTADELTIVFTSSRPGGLGDRDLFMAERATADEPFEAPFNLGTPVNSPGWEHNAHISPEGLQLYFASDGVLYMASRETRQDRFTSKVGLGSCVSSGGGFNTGPSMTSDGLELFYFSDRAGGRGAFDIWHARRATTEEAFCDVQNVASLNTGADDLHSAISADGLAIIFDSPSRSPTNGENDIWIATRPTRDDPFSSPANINDFGLRSEVNGPQVDYTASLSPGWPQPGAKLYFSRALPGFTGQQLYEATWITDPPEAVVSVDPSPALVHQEITLDGSGSFSRGPYVIQSFAWNLGDGKNLDGSVLRHTYEAPGRYAVTLTVVDERGRTDSSTMMVDVVCGGTELEPWTSADIGMPAYPGSAVFEPAGQGRCINLCAGGIDFSRSTNEGHQVFTGVSGDAVLTASLEVLDGRRGAKVGLLLRESVEPDAASVVLLVEKGMGRLLFQVRDPSGFHQQVVGGGVVLPDKLWLQIRRLGGEVIGSIATDGRSWTEVARTAIEFSDAPLLGFAGTGRDVNAALAFTPLMARFCEINLELQPPSALFHRGDPNSSGTTDISDGIAIFGHLFLGDPPTLLCKESADTNNDGNIDITDGIYLLNWLFTGGPEPAAPGPSTQPCGSDPDPAGAPGDLGCDEYTACK